MCKVAGIMLCSEFQSNSLSFLKTFLIKWFCCEKEKAEVKPKLSEQRTMVFGFKFRYGPIFEFVKVSLSPVFWFRGTK